MQNSLIRQKLVETSGDIQLLRYHKMTKLCPLPCLHLLNSSYPSPLHQTVKTLR